MLARGALWQGTSLPVTMFKQAIAQPAHGQRICACLTFSTSSPSNGKKSYPLLIVGGGTGGAAVANKFARKLRKGQVAVLEPRETHYYQPMWTLVGAGIRQFPDSARPMSWVLPEKADWIKDRVATFNPEHNMVTTEGGDEIKYEYLVVGLGLQLNYNKVPGLLDALEHDPTVCSNYWDHTVQKTLPAMEAFKSGHAIFTFPNTPIKCAGAPQKIMYLFEDKMRKTGRRDNTTITYNTSLPAIFGIPKYAEALANICKERDIKVNTRTHLVEMDHTKKEATFENLDSMEKTKYEYDFLHVTPPMSAPDVLRNTSLVDETGYVDVDRNTLQHKRFPNVLGIGDCTNVPTSKTAAACSSQALAVEKTLTGLLDGSLWKGDYDGYTSCPLTTSYNKVILAEFGFDGQILETFPINQSKESRMAFLLKNKFFPDLYWHGLVKGVWNGPKFYRRLLSLGSKP